MAVEEGRTIFANVQKFVLFFLGTNVAQVWLSPTADLPFPSGFPPSPIVVRV